MFSSVLINRKFAEMLLENTYLFNAGNNYASDTILVMISVFYLVTIHT